MTTADMVALAEQPDFLADRTNRLMLADWIEETSPTLLCNLALLRGDGPVEMRDGNLYPSLALGDYINAVRASTNWGEMWAGDLWHSAVSGLHQPHSTGHEQVAAKAMPLAERRKYLERFADARAHLSEQLSA